MKTKATPTSSTAKTELYPLVDRLRCKYNGRDFGGKMEVILPTGIMLEAAEVIAQQNKDLPIFAEDWKEYGNYEEECDCRQCALSRKYCIQYGDSLPWKE